MTEEQEEIAREWDEEDQNDPLFDDDEEDDCVGMDDPEGNDD